MILLFSEEINKGHHCHGFLGLALAGLICVAAITVAAQRIFMKNREA